VLSDLVRDTTTAEVLATPGTEALLLVTRGWDHVGDHGGVQGLVRTRGDGDVLDQRAGLQWRPPEWCAAGPVRGETSCRAAIA